MSDRAGRVASALARAEELTGDPAALAVSWAELLDGALLPATGVVSLDERGAAGEARVVAPRHEPPRESAVRAAGSEAEIRRERTMSRNEHSG